VVKPFSHQELLARIYAQLRPLGESQLLYGPIKVEPGSRNVYWQNESVMLKPKEFDLLLLLIQNPGRVFHREELLNKIWGYQAFPTTRTVDNHVLRLRQKLPDLAIETHRGVGYRLVML
jgi:DNA-binding response OmpR family regulator